MKGSSPPTVPRAGMMWLEDDNPSSTVWTLWIYDGADWIALGFVDSTNNIYTPNAQPEQSVSVSSGTMDIGAKYTAQVTTSSTSTVTSLGTAPAGTVRRVRHTAALQYTYNATSLITPGLANFTTAAGDVLTWFSLGSGNWVCTGLYRASLPGSGTVTSVVAGDGLTGGNITSSGTIAIDSSVAAIGTFALMVNASGGSISTGATVSGSSLRYAKGSSSNAFQNTGNTPSGTWRNQTGGALANNEFGIFQRTA